MNSWFITNGGKTWMLCQIVAQKHGGMVEVKLHAIDPSTGQNLRAIGKPHKAHPKWGYEWIIEGMK